ncbi:dihydrolipoamide acetyltransferase family protein [Alkalihalobacillus sp. BA299]|uniref:dihydrolipoamide acetyltransferase family protein n=1 Tax=Alkalihalobacillus sp. BA299 TaxID=2815938 RepID=UPI001AD9A157|nr:dihydrolipoamide acetyltransferase family protein [Alkalihalobacillus sp. BA299]
MAKEIFMPKLSSTMQVGTLLQWFKDEGETVEVGEPLFEIMTDKINIEVEAYEEGTLIKRYFSEDDEVPVNHVIGYIGNENESVPETPPGESGAEASEETGNSQPESSAVLLQSNEAASPESDNLEKVRATPAARRMAKEKGISLVQVPGSGPNGRVHKSDVKVFLIENKGPNATPLAKKVAQAEGVELTSVSGTGSNGKIYRNDVENTLQVSNEIPSASPKRIKMEGIRKIVAKRMLESKTTAPHVTLTSEIDMSEAIKMRKQLLGNIEKKTGYRLSYTEIILKATAYMLKQHPNINASLQGDEIVYHDVVNIGLAVAVDNGLLVPVVKNADQKGLATLTADCKALGKAARENKLKPDEMSGGTFTISNLGMYAVDGFTPVINQPESAILGVGRINEKPVGVNGNIELRPMMSVSLSFDHRIIDGAPAAAFLTDLKSVLEQPFELFI